MVTTITAFTDVTGNPAPNSTWTRNGSPLASGMMYGTDSTGVLMISNVMLADSGNYTSSVPSTEPPVLRRESAVMTVVENSAFSFNISQSLGYPPDPSQNSQRATLTYQWFLNGVPINTHTSINPNVSDYPQIVFQSTTEDSFW